MTTAQRYHCNFLPYLIVHPLMTYMLPSDITLKSRGALNCAADSEPSALPAVAVPAYVPTVPFGRMTRMRFSKSVTYSVPLVPYKASKSEMRCDVMCLVGQQAGSLCCSAFCSVRVV